MKGLITACPSGEQRKLACAGSSFAGVPASKVMTGGRSMPSWKDDVKF